MDFGQFSEYEVIDSNFLNQCLIGFGLDPIDYNSPAACTHCVYSLIKRVKNDITTIDSLTSKNYDLIADVRTLTDKRKSHEETIKQLDHKFAHAESRIQAIQKQHRRNISQIEKKLEEVEKINISLKHKDCQYNAALKRKELENTKLKQRLESLVRQREKGRRGGEISAAIQGDNDQSLDVVQEDLLERRNSGLLKENQELRDGLKMIEKKIFINEQVIQFLLDSADDLISRIQVHRVETEAAKAFSPASFHKLRDELKRANTLMSEQQKLTDQILAQLAKKGAKSAKNEKEINRQERLLAEEKDKVKNTMNQLQKERKELNQKHMEMNMERLTLLESTSVTNSPASLGQINNDSLMTTAETFNLTNNHNHSGNSEHARFRYRTMSPKSQHQVQMVDTTNDDNTDAESPIIPLRMKPNHQKYSKQRSQNPERTQSSQSPSKDNLSGHSPVIYKKQLSHDKHGDSGLSMSDIRTSPLTGTSNNRNHNIPPNKYNNNGKTSSSTSSSNKNNKSDILFDSNNFDSILNITTSDLPSTPELFGKFNNSGASSVRHDGSNKFNGYDHRRSNVSNIKYNSSDSSNQDSTRRPKSDSHREQQQKQRERQREQNHPRQKPASFSQLDTPQLLRPFSEIQKQMQMGSAKKNPTQNTTSINRINKSSPSITPSNKRRPPPLAFSSRNLGSSNSSSPLTSLGSLKYRLKTQSPASTTRRHAEDLPHSPLNPMSSRSTTPNSGLGTSAVFNFRSPLTPQKTPVVKSAQQSPSLDTRQLGTYGIDESDNYYYHQQKQKNVDEEIEPFTPLKADHLAQFGIGPIDSPGSVSTAPVIELP
eukprot:TRINITY_DN7531_c0_g1_i1.p1 TRINITY_DN7531_c0_g1~~TRINITY_DN7531_c0_g1_i1.p1  ORF type:complete len:825 (-),score=199.41 TRINITY_DN7531_c0_g1_i1:121-2595(-)